MAKRTSERTLGFLRKEGFLCQSVEKFNPFVGERGIRQDLFGFIDIIAIKEKMVVGVQACGADYQSHIRKITRDCGDKPLQWLESGAELWLIGWRKIKEGKRQIYRPRIKVFSFADFITEDFLE